MQSLHAKGYKPLHVGVLLHLHEYLPVNALSGDNDIILAHHQHISGLMLQEPIILEIIIKPIQYNRAPIPQILTHKVPLLIATDNMQRGLLDINPRAGFPCQLMHCRGLVLAVVDEELVAGEDVQGGLLQGGLGELDVLEGG